MASSLRGFGDENVSEYSCCSCQMSSSEKLQYVKFLFTSGRNSWKKMILFFSPGPRQTHPSIWFNNSFILVKFGCIVFQGGKGLISTEIYS